MLGMCDKSAEIVAAMPVARGEWIEGGDALGEIIAAKPG